MQIDHRYPVGPRELFEVLVDPVFLQARSERYGGVGAPSVAREGADVRVRTGRQLPLDHVPSAFRRFVGDGRVEQTDIWMPATDGATDIAGQWSVDTGRAPINLNGHHVITGDGGGCTYVVTAEIKVSVPVVAGRLRREVETYLSHLIASEQRFLGAWLTA